jgi:hypothetical protein
VVCTADTFVIRDEVSAYDLWVSPLRAIDSPEPWPHHTPCCPPAPGSDRTAASRDRTARAIRPRGRDGEAAPGTDGGLIGRVRGGPPRPRGDPWMSFTTLGMSGLASAVRGRSADQKPRRPSGASERQGRDAVAGPGARIPSDSRHLLGLRQALLRRGKQMSGRTHGEPRATRLLMGSPPAQTPALLWCRCSGHGGLRSSATSANDRLRIAC